MLRLKDEFVGMTITKNIFNVGMITFDALKVPITAYQNYYDIGFDFLFDRPQPKYNAPKKYKGVDPEKPAI